MSARACLLTGGSGFIGRPLARHLLDTGVFDAVVNLDVRAGDAARGPSPEGLHEVRADITSPLDPAALPDLPYTHCLHLAAVAKEPGYEHEEYYRVNLLGTRHVLTLCDALGVDHVSFTSTMMVFPAGPTRYGEADLPAPDTAYGGSKALAELEVWRWAAAAPDRVAHVVRPAVVFGPEDEGNFTRLRNSLAKRAFFYVGSRDTVKSCIHVDDVVGFLAHLVTTDAPSGTFHAAFPTETRIESIVEAIFDAFGGRHRVPTVPYRLARAASSPFPALGLDARTGVHPRRIDKLANSTNISADAMCDTGYRLQYPDIAAACRAWAEAER